MSKKSIALIVFVLFVTVAIISLYTTFAYNEEEAKIGETDADYNLIYSLKNQRKQEVIIAAGDTKMVDVGIKNTYGATVKYGLCYKLIEPSKVPNGLKIELASESENPLEGTILSDESKVVTVKITNNSEYNVDLLIGALVGFENGNLADLLTGEEILIK